MNHQAVIYRCGVLLCDFVTVRLIVLTGDSWSTSSVTILIWESDLQPTSDFVVAVEEEFSEDHDKGLIATGTLC
jgi:hypothetical protein